jgi:cell division protein FtsZ
MEANSMTLNFRKADSPELKPKLIVFGVGGAGGNAVNNMLNAELEGVDFIAANTDSQALAGSRAPRKIQLGANITQGLGAGSKPEVGAAAAEASLPEIIDALTSAHMVFITAGMGGGTGTGAAPVIARAAREMGILTVGVVTKPFQFEGPRRQKVAEEGINELQLHVDTLIIIPNQNLFRIANEKTTFAQAFAMADEVLHSGVRGITDLMVIPGLMNLDFADVKTVMSEMGKAMMGTGEAEGQKRALEAAEAAIANPLLDDVSMKGARGVLIHITGGMDMTLFEVDESANRIRSECDAEANIKVGSTFDPRLEGRLRVSVVATGIDACPKNMAAPLQPRVEGQARPTPVLTTPAFQQPTIPGHTHVNGSAAVAISASAPQAQPSYTPQAMPVASTLREPQPNAVHALQAEVEAQQTRLHPSRNPMEDSVREAVAQRRARQGMEPRATAQTEPYPDLLATKEEEKREEGHRLPPVTHEAPPQRMTPPQPRPVAQAQGAIEPILSREDRSKKPFSFFERVTGARRAREEESTRFGQREMPATPQTAPTRVTPAAPEVPATRPRPVAEPKASSETLFKEQGQDDQLEIPAFLRRQAN